MLALEAIGQYLGVQISRADASWRMPFGIELREYSGMDRPPGGEVSYAENLVHCLAEAERARNTCDVTGRAHALRGAAECHRRLGDLAAAHQAFAESAELHRKTGDLLGLGWTLVAWSNLERQKSRFADAYARLTAAAQLGQRTGEIGLEIYALAGIAECRRIQGDYYRAAHEHIQLGERFRQLKDARGVVWALEGMGQILRMTGRRDSARRHFDKARRIAIAANDRRGLAYALKCHAECLADEGRFIEALEQSVFAVDLFSELGLAIGWAYAQKALGDIASLANEHALAAHAYSEARARFDSIGDDRGVAYMDVASGFLALRDSQWDVALLKAEIGRKMFLAAHIRLGVRRAERLAAAARARRLS